MLRTMSSSNGLATQFQGSGRNGADARLPSTLFAHPGRAEEPRVLDVESSEHTRELNVTLPRGTRVGGALRGLLDRWSASAGCARIMAGACSRIRYHVVIGATQGPRPHVYGPPIEYCGPGTLVGATITIGRGRDGVRILHCHGGFIDAQGQQRGGHVNLDETIAGDAGLQLRLCLFGGIDIVVSHDTETAYDLLQPIRRQ